MKKRIVWFSACLSIGGALLAQTPKEHKKKTYVNEKEELYVNRNQPIYLRLATSPDGEGHILKSKATKAYSNPMYFDTEGKNTIRSPYAVDPKTGKIAIPKQDVIFEVYADGLAPVSSHSYNKVPRYKKGNTLYIGKGLEIGLQARDAVSGVDSIFYSLNGSSFAYYDQTLNGWKEGENTLSFYGLDKVGNVEKIKEVRFVLDTAGPQVNYQITGPQEDNILSPDAQILVHSKDLLSGVKNIKYKVDKGALQTYLGPISFGKLEDGDHRIVFSAEDFVGNKTTTVYEDVTFTFYVDRYAPEMGLKIEGDLFKNGKYTYVSSRSQVSLDATDTRAGVGNIHFWLNNDKEGVDYKNPFTFEQKDGLQKVRFFGIDRIGNRSLVKEETFYFDNHSPKTWIDYKGTQFFDRDTLFITSKTKVLLPSKDKASGVQATYFTINNKEEERFEKPVQLEKDGLYTIHFHSVDNVSNKEQVKESYVFVDNTPPEIFVNFSIKPIGHQTVDGKELDVFPSHTKMYLAATDRKAGNSHIFYAINGGALTEYSSPKTLDASELQLFKENKAYSVRIIARDNLGNESEKIIEFAVED